MRFARLAFAAFAVLVPGATALAQDRYPTRPIEFVVPWGPGGGADQAARKIGKILEPLLKVSIPIVNVPGASGVAGLNKVLTSPADGYTLHIMTADTTGILVTSKPKWSMSDVIPLAMATQQRSGLFVKEGGKYSSWAEVEAAARQGELKAAITGLASPEELAVNFFKRRGLKFTAVPYARPGERYAAVIGGHADVLYEQAGDIKSFVDSKQLKPILFLSNEKVAGFESVPTTKDLGIDLVLDQYRLIAVKTGTDQAIVKILAEKLGEAMRSEEYVKYLEEQTAEPNSYLGAEATRAYVTKDLEDMQRLLN